MEWDVDFDYVRCSNAVAVSGVLSSSPFTLEFKMQFKGKSATEHLRVVSRESGSPKGLGPSA